MTSLLQLKVSIFQTFFLLPGSGSSSLPSSCTAGAMGVEQCWVWCSWQEAQPGPCPSRAGLDAEPCIRCALVLPGCCSFHFCSEAACSPRWALPPCPCPPRGWNEVLVPSLLCWWLCFIAQMLGSSVGCVEQLRNQGFFKLNCSAIAQVVATVVQKHRHVLLGHKDIFQLPGVWPETQEGSPVRKNLILTEAPGGKPCCGVRAVWELVAGRWQSLVGTATEPGGPPGTELEWQLRSTHRSSSQRRPVLGWQAAGPRQREEREALSGRQQQGAAWSRAGAAWAWRGPGCCGEAMPAWLVCVGSCAERTGTFVTRQCWWGPWAGSARARRRFSPATIAVPARARLAAGQWHGRLSPERCRLWGAAAADLCWVLTQQKESLQVLLKGIKL